MLPIHRPKSRLYKRVVSELSRGPCTASVLADRCETVTRGTFTEILNDLSLAGFIESYRCLLKPRSQRLIRYRILDEYLHFYHRFIQPHAHEIVAGSLVPYQVFNSNEYRQWRGHAFERICRRHAKTIAKHLDSSSTTCSRNAEMFRNLSRVGQSMSS